MRAPDEINMPTLRALRGVSQRDLEDLYSNGSEALWRRTAPLEWPEPPPAWQTAARLHFTRTHALLAMRKAHRGLGCLRRKPADFPVRFYV